MAINYTKKYNDLLEINHFSVTDRAISLRSIFDRDIADNLNFTFRTKIIRPLKKEDVYDVESLFKHLTHRTSEEKDHRGVVVKKRDDFDFERSKRIHWVLPHIKESLTDEIRLFSSVVRIKNKDVTRTFIHNVSENYLIILEPQRSGLDYYLITAYYLEKKYGGPNAVKSLYKRRLEVVY